jgi:hypothetical protein
MSNFNVKSLLEAKNPQAIVLEQTRGLKNKWSKTGLLEGLKERDQHSMAVLLENQAQQLLQESSQTNANTQGSEEWSGVALPLVRRIFGEIAAKEFVSVQPMNLPSGLIFFMDFKYGNTKGDKTALTSLYGGTGAKFGRTDAVTGGLYGNGTYGYSLPSQSIVASVPATVTSASWADAGFRQEYSASIAGADSKLKKYVIPVTSLSSSYGLVDVEAVKTFVLGDSSIVINLNEFATHNAAGDSLTFIVSASAHDTTVSTIKFSTQPQSYQRGDFEDQNPIYSGAGAPGAGTNLNIPEIDLELKSESIVAKTRKLKAVWTPELAQDLNAYHSIDAEAELTSMLSEYISLEIDLEILDMLQVNALTTDYWSATVGEEYNPTTGIWAGGNSSLAYQKSTWFQTLGVKINKVSNKIHQLTMRGGANFIVASPDVCTILESIPGFHVNAEKDAMQFAAGVSVVGSISNRYTVYKNPYMTHNQILLGYKGANFLETGAVYAPYVPLIMTPLVYDPDNFTPRRGVMTRYAKKIVRPEFYGRIYVKDLNLI